MILTENEKCSLKELSKQEERCIKKYDRFSDLAKDEELKTLFSHIADDERKHHTALEQLLSGTVPMMKNSHSAGKDFQAKKAYNPAGNSAEKENDSFLVSDCIASEKLTSGDYNSNVFKCCNSDVRNILADIEVDEQNHGEMLLKYQQANSMQ